ncbi:MAG: LuxR C-terminal-related transcriptional regulator [Actinomycetota bacterium]|nr:LuxR C-terminal-related transcriptional regulator [Actinomycetota bacterium]
MDLRRAIDSIDRRRWRAPHATRSRQRLAELLAADGRTDEALALTEVDLRAASEADAPGASGATLRTRALALPVDERRPLLEQAIACLARSPLRLDLARAQVELAGALSADGRKPEARTTLKEALATATPTGATGLISRAREELRAAGGRLRRDPATGSGSLTPGELRTAELAARGLSNREIAEALWVTLKTVEYHLSNVYSKLEVGSRADLPARLNQPDLDV